MNDVIDDDQPTPYWNVGAPAPKCPDCQREMVWNAWFVDKHGNHDGWYSWHCPLWYKLGHFENVMTQPRVTQSGAADGDPMSDRQLEADLADLRAALARAQQEIAEAREACPIVRRQDYFDAPLLTLIEQEVSQLFQMQSRAEQLEADLTAMRAEHDALQQVLADEKDANRNLQASLALHEAPDKVTFSADYYHEVLRCLGADDTDDMAHYAGRLKERAEAAEARVTNLRTMLEELRNVHFRNHCDIAACGCEGSQLAQRVAAVLAEEEPPA
jgi:hypothetical protein